PPSALLRLLERPAEEAARERAPGQHPDPMRAARGDDLQLDGAGAQIVEALLGDDAEEVPGGRRTRGLRDLPASEVAAPDVEDLSGGDELLHRLPQLFPGRGTVDMVHLVEIDAVGPEAFQALVAGTADVMGGQTRIVRSPAHPSVDLGGEDDLVASATLC